MVAPAAETRWRASRPRKYCARRASRTSSHRSRARRGGRDVARVSALARGWARCRRDERAGRNSVSASTPKHRSPCAPRAEPVQPPLRPDLLRELAACKPADSRGGRGAALKTKDVIARARPAGILGAAAEAETGAQSTHCRARCKTEGDAALSSSAAARQQGRRSSGPQDALGDRLLVRRRAGRHTARALRAAPRPSAASRTSTRATRARTRAGLARIGKELRAGIMPDKARPRSCCRRSPLTWQLRGDGAEEISQSPLPRSCPTSACRAGPRGDGNGGRLTDTMRG